MNVRVSKSKNSFGELLKTLMVAGSIAIIFRSIFFEPFNIPSGSMIPTLLVGDYLFARSFQLMTETGRLDVLETLSNASANIAEGEVLQLTASEDITTDEEI